MSQFIVEGILGEDSPATFHLNISAFSDHNQAVLDPRNAIRDDYEVSAFIDTGSRQTLINPGLFDKRHFGSDPLIEDFSNSKRERLPCTGQVMRLTFKSGMRMKMVEVPVFEMQFSNYLSPGFMLIGRTVLDHCLLTYDGPNKRVTLSFADDDDHVKQ